MAETPPSLGVVGLGRLGHEILRTCADRGVTVVLTASRETGWGSAGVPDVLVDVSAPEAHEDVYDYCTRYRVPLVECVSNLDDRQWARLTELSERVPVVRAANLAFGHYVQRKVVRYLAGLLPPHPETATTAVWERHPLSRTRRPSTSALALTEAWEQTAGTGVHDVSSQRDGLPVSEHTFNWTWSAEVLSVRHAVRSLSAAASGVLVAANWAATHTSGLADMQDVFDDRLTGD